MSHISSNPEPDVTGRIRCVRCAHDNPSSRRYCNNCGENLLHPCPHCSVNCAVDEKFCGQCGSDIDAWVSEQRDAIEGACRTAAVYRDSNDFDAAVKILKGAMRQDHPALHAVAEHASLLYEQIRACRQQRRDEVAAFVERAAEKEHTKQYKTALELLSKIPEPLRDPQVQKRFAALEQKVDALDIARQEIRAAIANRRTRDLLPKVLALFKEQPNDEQLERLTKQLLQQNAALAKQLIAAQRFDEALELLLMIPAKLRGDGIVQVIQQFREPAYLIDVLQSSPVADELLVNTVQRLRKVANNNKSIAQRSAQIVKRCEKAAENQNARPLWAKSPDDGPLGLAIDLEPRAFGVDDSVALENSDYRECPARFHAAIGLALQGLGEATVNTNLLPREQTSIRQTLGRILRSKKLPVVDSAWGIEYDDREVRIVGIQRDGEQGVRIQHCQSMLVTHDEEPLANTDQSAREDTDDRAPENEPSPLTRTIGSICEELELAGQHVVLGLPGIHVLSRLMEIPRSTREKVELAIRYESKHQIPFDLDETIWDYHVLRRIGDVDEGPPTIPVALFATKEFRVAERLAAFKHAGVDIHVTQSTAAALYNLAIRRHASHSKSRCGETIALLDVGYNSTSCVVVGGGIFWSRSWYGGIASCESELCSQLGLTAAAAAQVMREPAKVSRLSDLAWGLQPYYESTSRETALSLTTFKSQHPDVNVKCIIGTGQGIQTHGLVPYLRRGVSPFVDIERA